MGKRGYDVAIAGGGPAGAAAAVLLARAGLRVLLADARNMRRLRADRDRVGESLVPSAHSLLRELGAEERVLVDGHRPSHGTCAFWGSDTPRSNDFLFQLHGQGLQLDRSRFDASLVDLARDGGAHVRTRSRLSFERDPGGRGPHQLLMRGPYGDDRIECRWLVDATGRAATPSRRLGAKRVTYDRLVAFHMRLGSEAGTDVDGRTWVEAVENGWWYSVLLPSGERLVALLTEPDLVDRQTLLTQEGLWQALREARQVHGLCLNHHYHPTSAPLGADACSSHLDTVAGELGERRGWLAVGDAALAFDPLSAKGIPSAIYTGLRGAQAIVSAIGDDSGAISRYARHVHAIHRAYREHLRVIYGMRKGRPRSKFWDRRTNAGDGTRVP